MVACSTSISLAWPQYSQVSVVVPGSYSSSAPHCPHGKRSDWVSSDVVGSGSLIDGSWVGGVAVDQPVGGGGGVVEPCGGSGGGTWPKTPASSATWPAGVQLAMPCFQTRVSRVSSPFPAIC
jgi:hypothetical protein